MRCLEYTRNPGLKVNKHKLRFWTMSQTPWIETVYSGFGNLGLFLLGAYLYPIMPERMASHWDTSGSINGYMSKLLGRFLMPVISTIIFPAFPVIPKIDPLKENIA